MAKQLDQAIAAGLAQTSAISSAAVRVAVQVDDLGIRCGVLPNSQVESLSVIKVATAGALLYQAQLQRRRLTAVEKSLVELSITQSDNDATTLIWRRIGQVNGLRLFLKRANVPGITPNAVYWGNALVSADSLITLLRQIGQGRVLTKSNRSYLFGAMRRVVPEQRWGVPTGSTAKFIALKNGWGARSFLGYRTTSIGLIKSRSHTYRMAIVTTGNADYASGQVAASIVAGTINNVLN